jgi:hypothetical protein
MAARRMLELKGIPYKRVDLMPVISRGALGRCALQHRAVALDRGARSPALAPSRSSIGSPLYRATKARGRRDEAERWGRGCAAGRSPHPGTPCSVTRASYAEGPAQGPIGIAVRPRHRSSPRQRMTAPATRQPHRLAPAGWLQRVDDWIAEGALGADPQRGRPADRRQPALAMTLDDLRPAIQARRPASWRCGRSDFPNTSSRASARLTVRQGSEPARSTR